MTATRTISSHPWSHLRPFTTTDDSSPTEMFRVALPAGQYGGRFAGIFVSGLDIVPDDRLTQAFPSSSEQAL